MLAGNGEMGFHPNGDRFTTIVDSYALIPRLGDSMRDHKKLKEAKTIVTAGIDKLFVTGTGTIWGYIIDQAGHRVPVRISAMVVPGLGRNLFSSVK